MDSVRDLNLQPGDVLVYDQGRGLTIIEKVDDEKVYYGPYKHAKAPELWGVAKEEYCWLRQSEIIYQSMYKHPDPDLIIAEYTAWRLING